METAITSALAYRVDHPSESTRKLADRFGVPKSTLHDRLSGTHHEARRHPGRALNIEQEDALIETINRYAARGTLLTPSGVRDYAEIIGDTTVSRAWVTRFVSRHPDRITLAFLQLQGVWEAQGGCPRD